MKQNSFHIFYLRLASHGWIWVTALGSGPSLQMISQLLTQSLFLGALWSACWIVSTPWVHAISPLRMHPFPISSSPSWSSTDQTQVHLGWPRDWIKGRHTYPRWFSGSPAALNSCITRCYLVLSRYRLVVQSSFSVMLLLTRKCAEHPSSIPFFLSFSNIHTPSPRESLLYTCFSPVSPGPDPSFHG